MRISWSVVFVVMVILGLTWYAFGLGIFVFAALILLVLSQA